MNDRALGWFEDTEDRHTGPAHRLFGALPPTLELPDLMPFRAGLRAGYYQGRASSCVAFASKRCLQLFYAANRDELDTSPLPPEASARFMYRNGRIEEFAGLPLDQVPALVDEGTQPGLMIRSLQGVGFCAEEACPYDVERINDKPSDDAYVQAYSQKDLESYVINESGDARIERAVQALRRRCPVMFGMKVDSAFMAHRGDAPITSIDGKSVAGGHMLAILKIDLERRVVVFDNWWKNFGYGDDIGCMSFELFGSPWLKDVIVFKAAPMIAGVS